MNQRPLLGSTERVEPESSRPGSERPPWPTAPARIHLHALNDWKGNAMSHEAIPVTEAGYHQLVAELEHLRADALPAAAARLEQARAFGDLRENAEYAAAHEEHQRLTARLAELMDVLGRATLVAVPTGGDADVVGLGATVVLRGDDGQVTSWRLVSAAELSEVAGQLSDQCPVGQALLGRRAGDQVSVPTPAGSRIYTLLAVSYDGPGAGGPARVRHAGPIAVEHAPVL